MLKMLCFIFFCYHNVLHSHSKRQPWLSMELKNDDEYIIDTPGCAIPNVWREFQIVEPKNCHSHCGTRAVYVKKVANNSNLIKFIIKHKRMTKILGNNSYECCFQFVFSTPVMINLKFTPCKLFLHGTIVNLEHEAITVKCKLIQTLPSSNPTYDDAYIVLKELHDKKVMIFEESWNVLILGMDTMSRARAFHSMPKLVKYLKYNNWLDYRAFQKAASNTYPNLMILHTGKKESTYRAACKPGVDECKDLMMWTKFSRSGYVTAYGEDFRPPTLDFKKMPTDHYTRLFFLLNYLEIGNIICLGKRPAAHHVLDYAYQFVKAYQDYHFYGFFWLVTYSHDPNRVPTLLQNRLIRFFEKINRLGANNTIIVLLGDHGIRYGPQKIPVESFYDEQLPMLFMKLPHAFKKKHIAEFRNLKINQRRLITHSDLHSTLWNILKLSDVSVTIEPPEFCPQCSSLFVEKPKDRRCESMEVHERWCSCHVLNEVDSADIAATRVPETLLQQIIRVTRKQFQIKSILRHHWFRHDFDYKNNITNYFIAMQLLQGNTQYEGVVQGHGTDFYVMEFDVISPRDEVLNC